MRRCYTVALTLAFAMAQTFARAQSTDSTSGAVVRSYDRFSNLTTFSTGPLLMSLNAMAGFSFTCPGDVSGCRPARMLFTIGEHNDAWQHLDENILTFLLDDTERIRFGNRRHAGTIQGAGVFESRDEYLTIAQARRIASAGSVELQWTRSTFLMPPLVQSSLKNLLAATR